MNDSIDRIDSHSDIRPGEIIKRVNRSSKEKDQKNGFSDKLKEKLKEQLKDGNKKKQEDTLELTQPENEEKNKTDESKEAKKKNIVENNAEIDNDEPLDHVDIKA